MTQAWGWGSRCQSVEWETTDGTLLSLELWDTAGQEGFEELRKLSYPGTEIYIVAYACNSEITLKNVEYKWVPEIQRNLESAVPQAWIILVGTKVDLRTEDEGVSQAQAEKVASDIGAIGFVETSALSGIGIQEVMKQIIQKAVDKAQNKEMTIWNESDDANISLKGSTIKEDNSYQGDKEKPAQPGPVTSGSAKPAGVKKEDDGCCVVM